LSWGSARLRAVTEDEFWQLIEAAGAGRDRHDGGDAMAEAVTDLLATRDLDVILDYQEHFDRLHGALYQRKYWAAGYVIGGGCSDDAFIDFRVGVISLGRDWHQRFRADLDCLPDHEEVRFQAARGADEAMFAEPVTMPPRVPTSGSRASGTSSTIASTNAASFVATPTSSRTWGRTSTSTTTPRCTAACRAWPRCTAGRPTERRSPAGPCGPPGSYGVEAGRKRPRRR